MKLTPVKELLEKANANLGQAESHASFGNMDATEAEIVAIRTRLEKLIAKL